MAAYKAPAILAGIGWLLAAAGQALAAECASPATNLGVTRIVELDTGSGPLYGDITKFAKQESLLGPKEVVLTFDDGPLPIVTKSILDTLDRYCTKATFFAIGRMAVAYPATVKEVLARGHTLGTHTWSHPLSLRRMSFDGAREEIERGFAAVAAAAGQPIAPFFRFPGLSDNAPLLAHLQSRSVATFTVDVVSNDSYIYDAGRLAKSTMQKVDSRQGGIMLFHDIKAATARALPAILAELKERGYKVVHLRAKSAFQPNAEMTAKVEPLLAKAQAGKPALVPFFAGMSPPKAPDGVSAPPVMQLAPEQKPFEVAALRADQKSDAPRARKPRHRGSELAPPTTGWATTLRR